MKLWPKFVPNRHSEVLVVAITLVKKLSGSPSLLLPRTFVQCPAPDPWTPLGPPFLFPGVSPQSPALT